MSGFSYTREERLSGNNEYDRVFTEGKAFRTRSLTTLATPNPCGVSRIGLSVGRRVGSAVRRNRIKRVLREAYRLNKAELSIPCDIVFIPRRGLEKVGLRVIEPEVRHILRKIDETFSA